MADMYENFEPFEQQFTEEHDVEIVTSFLLPRTRLNNALENLTETTAYQVIPVTYPVPTAVFGEYVWLVTVCPPDITMEEDFHDWVDSVSSDEYLTSEQFLNIPEEDRFVHCEEHGHYITYSARFYSLDSETVMEKADRLIASEEWNALNVHAWLSLKNAEEWIDEEVEGVASCDCFHQDFAEFPLEVALNTLAEALNSEAIFSNFDDEDDCEDDEDYE